MGSLLSRFRKKPTTMEQLQSIEDSLIKIEDYKRHTERSQKRAVANVLIYGAALYILACVIVFVWYLPESWLVRLGLLIPLVLVPLIIYRMKRFISKYFHNKMVRANEDYADLQKKKKGLIDNVMETETFNKAREILAKYAPERLDKKLQDPYVNRETVVAKTSTTDLRQRNNTHITTSTTTLPPLPKPPAVLKMEINDLKEKLRNPAFTTRPLPKPVFNKERSLSEKLVDYLIGDGPENRYALICKFCNGHNGMALKEEFQFISYSCCYCLEYNVARSKRPTAPRLSTEVQPMPDKRLPVLESGIEHKTENFLAKESQSKKSELFVHKVNRTENRLQRKVENKTNIALSNDEHPSKPNLKFDEFSRKYAKPKETLISNKNLFVPKVDRTVRHTRKVDHRTNLFPSSDEHFDKCTPKYHSGEDDDLAHVYTFLSDFKKWQEMQTNEKNSVQGTEEDSCPQETVLEGIVPDSAEQPAQPVEGLMTQVQNENHDSPN